MPEFNLRRWVLVLSLVLGVTTLVASLLSTPVFLGLAVVCLAVAAIVPVVDRLRSRNNPAEVLFPFLLYFVLTLGVRGLTLLTYEDSFFLPGLQDPRSYRFQELVGWSFLYSALGLAFLYAGYRSSTALRWGERLAVATRPWASDLSRRVPWVAVAWLGVGLLGAAMFVRTYGGVRGASEDLVYVATEGALGNFWKLALMDFALVGLHLLLLHALLRRRGKPLAWTLFFGAPLVAGLFLITSSKYLLLRAVVPAVLYVHFLRRRIRLAHLGAVALLFALLFPLFYAYRGGASAFEFLADTVESRDLGAWFRGGNILTRGYGTDSFVAVLDRVGRDVPFQHGRTMLDVFVFFIPRAWWPEKPMSYGAQFGGQFFPQVDLGGLTYFSPSLPGELFLNFHVVGIAIGFWLLGVLMRAAYGMARSGGPAGVMLYGYAYLVAIHVAEGGIASKFEFLLMDLVPAWIALRLLQPSLGRSVTGVHAVVPVGAASGRGLR